MKEQPSETGEGKPTLETYSMALERLQEKAHSIEENLKSARVNLEGVTSGDISLLDVEGLQASIREMEAQLKVMDIFVKGLEKDYQDASQETLHKFNPDISQPN
jgi:hypothetical protein